MKSPLLPLLALATATTSLHAQIPANPAESPFADKPADSYAAYKGADGKPATLIWGQAPFTDYGSRPVVMDPTGVRHLNPPPAPGVHPRILFGPDDLADVRKRVKETKCGQEAWKNILSWTEAMKGNYDDTADYAKPDKTQGGWQSLHARVPLSRLGMPLGSVPINGSKWNKSDKAAALYAALANGSATDVPDYYWNAFSLEAFRCLIEDDKPAAETLAKAAITALKIGQAKRAADPKQAGKTPVQPIGAFQLAFTYDLIFNWLDKDQRAAIHDELALSTWSHDNYGTFNTAESSRSNWATFSYWLFQVLAIEGEPGFNDLKVRGMFRGWRNLLTYGWFQSGATFEGEAKNQLGMDGVILFAAREKTYGFDNLAGHPYLRAYATKFLPQSINPMLSGFHKYDLLGGSRAGKGGFAPNDAIGLKYMLPDDKAVDWVYRQSIGENYEGVPDRPDGYFNALLFYAAYATDFDPANNDPAKLNLGNTFFCGERALMMTRSSWDKDAMQLNLHVRQDNGGHPFADRNSIMVAGAGRIWSPNGYANFRTAENSVVCIDGKSQNETVPGQLVDFQDTPNATFATGDAKYCWDWTWKRLEKNPGYYTIADVNSKLVTIPAGWEPEMHTANDFAYTKLPYAYLDVPQFAYPHWIQPKGALSPYVRQPLYPVVKAFRTAGLVRSEKPYALVIDDIQKDDAVHHYDWTLGLEYDIQIARVDETGPGMMDIFLTGSDPDQNKPRPKEPLAPGLPEGVIPPGQPMLLVRVLNRNLAPGKEAGAEPTILELPNLADAKKYGAVRRLVIPSDSVAPDYKILLYPFRTGDALPATTWNPARTELTVTIGKTKDTVTLTPNAQGKTNLALARDGQPLLTLKAEAPALK